MLAAALALAGFAAIGPAVHAAGEPLAQAVPCLPCHSRTNLAARPKVPNILGQDAKYLIHQISAFQRQFVAGKTRFLRLERRHPVMNREAPKLERDDIQVVAEYFAAQACVSARDIDGGPSESLPQPKLATRCFLCHGEGGRTHHAFVPSLAGQRMSYLRKQMQEFRDTKWEDFIDQGQARVHRMMTRQGLPLDDAQIDELAHYFASLPCR